MFKQAQRMTQLRPFHFLSQGDVNSDGQNFVAIELQSKKEQNILVKEGHLLEYNKFLIENKWIFWTK